MASPCISITDDRLAVLLEEIFLLLPAAADLVRVSAACVHFRQIATGSSFLRRFRRAHPPPFIGFVDLHGFRPALPPHTAAPVAGAVARAADFSFSFLPRPNRYAFMADPGCWNVQDIRDGRVLLDRGPKRGKGSVAFPELAVCDPLHRRYRLLPPIPADLAASVRDPVDLNYKRRCEVVLLPPGGKDVEAYETAFRVIWMAQCKTKVTAFVYSSTTGQWQSIASKGWGDLLACGMATVSLKGRLFKGGHYAHGCLYWPSWPMVGAIESGLKDCPREVMLVLDTMTMEFSVADYPPGRGWSERQIAIVEAEEGRLGLLTFSDEATSELRYTVRQNTDGSNNEWHLEKIISLGKGHHAIISNTDKYLLLRRSDSRLDLRTFHLERFYDKSECFSLDVKTFKLERVSEKDNAACGPIYAYFPPSLSSTTV